MLAKMIFPIFVFYILSSHVSAAPPAPMNPQKGCKADDEKGAEQDCVFPFQYKGKTFFGCTDFGTSNNKPWCAITPTVQGKEVKSPSWGDCKQPCAESYCPQKCKCKSGRVIDKTNGKDVLSNGYCQYYCSKRGYCGDGEKFNDGTDCTGCVSYKFVTSGTCDRGDKISKKEDCDKDKIKKVLPDTIEDKAAADGSDPTQPSGCYAVGEKLTLTFGKETQKGKCSSTNKCICKTSPCRTTGDAAGGKADVPCKLPFIYKKKQYDGCTVTDAYKNISLPWCSVQQAKKNNGVGIHEAGLGLWGNCASTCPTDDTFQYIANEFCKIRGKNGTPNHCTRFGVDTRTKCESACLWKGWCSGYAYSSKVKGTLSNGACYLFRSDARRTCPSGYASNGDRSVVLESRSQYFGTSNTGDTVCYAKPN